MAKPQKHQGQQVDEHEGIDLRGTLIGVYNGGLVIIIRCFGVWRWCVSR